MAFIDSIKDAVVKLRERVIAVSSTELRDQGKQALFPHWFFSALRGQPRRINLDEVRRFAKSPYAQICQRVIKNSVSLTPWDIVLADEDDQEDDIKNYEAEVKEVKDFLESTNVNGDALNDQLNSMLTDWIELDAGVLIKVFSDDSYEPQEQVEIFDAMGNSLGTDNRRVLKPFGQRTLLQLQDADGGTFLKNLDIFKRLDGYYQYSFRHPLALPLWFHNDEVMYFSTNKRPDDSYGYSPVQAILEILEVMIHSTRYNKEFFQNDAIPKAIASIKGADKDSIKKLKEDWERQVRGRGHKLMFVNSDGIDFETIAKSNRDMEWLEGQAWYTRLIFGMHGLSPAVAGFQEDVNRASQGGAERQSVIHAIKPYLRYAERIINTQLLTEILQDPNPTIKFKFFPEDTESERTKFEQAMQELEAGTLTINEYRRSVGREDLEGGDQPKGVITQNPLSPGEGFDETASIQTPRPTDDEKSFSLTATRALDGSHNSTSPLIDLQEPSGQPTRKDDSTNHLSKEIIEPGEGMIAESDDYSTFYQRQVDLWEEKTLKALSKIDDLKKAVVIEKTFGEFVEGMFNAVNTSKFVNKVRSFVKDGLASGLKSAEDEINIDIGFTSEFQRRTGEIQHQQLEGYTINGKKWHGIKGATNELRLKILSTVEEAVREGAGEKETTKRVKEVFTSAREGQAVRIARTETNRFINEGKLISYKEAGVSGRKAWVAMMDDRTSEVCGWMHEKYSKEGIPFDATFLNEETGKEFVTPPQHPNCRCTIEYRLDGGN